METNTQTKNNKTRTKIKEKSKALKGYTKSFKITIRNDTDPLGKTWKRKQEKQLNTV